MGIPSELRDAWVSTRGSRQRPRISSPSEPQVSSSDSTIRDAVTEGFKTASIAGAVAAVPTLVGCRVIPWAKANLNYTAQALIISAGKSLQSFHMYGVQLALCLLELAISTANFTLDRFIWVSIAGFFITADKTILKGAKKNSRDKFDKVVR